MSLTELPSLFQVLQRLRYVDANNAVQLKGRVACEISNHELIITELVFENVFTDLHPTEIVALLSCFVFQQVLLMSVLARINGKANPAPPPPPPPPIFREFCLRLLSCLVVYGILCREQKRESWDISSLFSLGLVAKLA